MPRTVSGCSEQRDQSHNLQDLFSSHRRVFEAVYGATGAAPAAANDQVRRGRSLPRPTGSGSCAGASQGLVTTDHILRGTSASVFFAPLPVDAAASVKREPFGSGSASLATAAQDTQTRLDSQSVSPTGNPRFSEKNMSKADRVREKNRLAQARFRQKQRVRTDESGYSDSRYSMHATRPYTSARLSAISS